jgi:lipoprotein-anchoring transpeptidase ErfK/SrfK
MKYTDHLKWVGLTAIAFITTLTSSCIQPPQQNTANVVQTNTANQPANGPQPSPSATEAKESVTVLTLPMLDAVLSDEGFVGEAKSTLQLTEDELQQLRTAARDAVLSLDEGAAENSRSTKAAASDARKTLQKVLGPDRTRRFIELVDKHAGNQDLAESKPNQIPTDTRVVVNAPAYRMDIFDKGKLVQSYKVGIGYPEFPLPTGLRQAKEIIFNPTWTPPDEPWVKGKVQAGKKVEAGSSLNPLGPIKIPIGLPNLIHGGKSPARLGTFASHGCVGLTNQMIQDFALKLSAVGGEQLSLDDIKNYAKAKTETKEVKFDNAIPVELRYETIVLENGTLKIYRDVYERGTNTEENLKKVLASYGLSLDEMQPDLKDKILKGLQQMAVDASGEPVDENQHDSSNSNRNAKSTSSKVTTTIKGQKVLEFPIPNAAGKGYPAPVGVKI